MNIPVPVYISIAFLIAICFPVYLLAQMASDHVKPKQKRTVFYGIIIFYATYFVVVGGLSLNGFFKENTLPPKIIKVSTLPLLLFLIGFVFNTGFYRQLLKSIPIDKLIYIHRFRFIGGVFIVLMLFGHLPPVFAWIAGTGDLITASSSFWVSRAIRHKTKHTKAIALIWNTFGFLDILATSFTAIYSTKVSIETGALGVEVLATFPFCFIPAFAPATIIFLHLSIYRKLLDKKFW